ncbi:MULTISPECIES: winged helix-turn-helix transcriptional regulator [Streptomyces]|uniref:ArsR family transcriptional regulator n=1 Tax=Streptomyces xanthochromogenes TaxID=67384 RepID=A0ABQ3B0H9_9ACTN|nr:MULTISPECIES: helix-turn-helix domain-containing protein [Streptomyces]MYV90754.1 transcriptional regulator [Streptomyces sp. SID1034]GGY73211.1 ArsR family transcriptional regulator [Streptomyces xanthochromogenes]
MTLGKDYDYAAQECSIARALEIIGERWTLLVMRDALYGVRRYNHFAEHLKIPRAVLAARLRALSEAGLLEKRQYQHTPPRHEYLVTDRGSALWPVLRSLGLWGRECLPGAEPLRTFHHADCGTELGWYGECPRCGKAVAPRDVETRPGPGALQEPGDPVSRALRAPRLLLQPFGTEEST